MKIMHNIKDIILITKYNEAENKLRDVLPSFGYTVTHARKRVNGEKNARQVYQIQGQWHDVELVADNNFMSLVAAKTDVEDMETLANPG